MKKILILFLCFLCWSAFAQQRVPATMVSVSTNGWEFLPSGTNLQGVLNKIDEYAADFTTTNYAPVYTTNTNVKIVTPRWYGDMLVIHGGSTQFWASAGLTTNDWHCLYPTMVVTTNAVDPTNTLPIAIGQFMMLVNPQTNILYCATNSTIGSWKVIFRNSNP